MGLQNTNAFARSIWLLIALMAALTVASFFLTALRVDPLSHPLLLLPFGLLGATWWFYATVRPDSRLRVFAQAFIQLLLILLFGTLLSYAAAMMPMPFQDSNLLAIDTALGLDRRAYVDFFARRPWLYDAVTLAYFTLMPQFVVVPLILFSKQRARRLQQFTFAVGISLLATVAISVFTPSITTVYLDLGLPVHAKVPASVYTPLPTLEALRSGAPYWVDLSAIEGLISFPSFHTVGALLFIWALWPISYFRWVALAVNAQLIMAAPFIGAHYFIDLAGGAVVAVFAVAVSRWSARRKISALDSSAITATSGQDAGVLA